MEKFPELKDFVQDVYFESLSKFNTLKEFIQTLDDIARTPGLSHVELLGIISESLDRCKFLESEEFKDSCKTLHQIEILAKDLNII